MEKKGSVKGLIPLFVFLGLYAGAAILTGNFGTMPLLTAFMITMGVALFLNRGREKKTLDEKIEMFCKGAGDSTLILMMLIFMDMVLLCMKMKTDIFIYMVHIIIMML